MQNSYVQKTISLRKMLEWEQSSPEVDRESRIPADMPPVITPKPKSSFKIAASILISECRKKNGKSLNCHSMSRKLDMERRRFFDIINVLDGIDYFKKIDTDTFSWRGELCARARLYQIAVNRGVFDSTKSLSEIFPSRKCISITTISIDILLIFSALQKRKIDLKDLSFYLSRGNGREKTMICKLYQAAAIFELAGIVEKTSSIGEFEISEEFYLGFSEDPTFTLSLLQNTPQKADFIAKRNADFNSVRNKRKKGIHKKKTFLF